MTRTLALLATLVLPLALAGCQSRNGVDPAVAALRERLVLASEPSGAVSPGEARSAIESSPEVVIAGVVDLQDQTSEKGKAVFVISELPPDGQAHGGPGHDAANCPFCKRRKAEAPLAVVQFVDDQGKVLSHDARELFGLKDHQAVVIRGRAQVSDLDLLLVNADGIYIRP
jgi:hypothetical protein